MQTRTSDSEYRFDQIMMGVGSLAVIAGLILILTPPLVPIHLLGALTAVGGALLLGTGLLHRGEDRRWSARATLLVIIEIVAAVVAVGLVLVLHILPL